LDKIKKHAPVLDPASRSMAGMNRAVALGLKLGLSRNHAAILSRLRTPEIIQDYITALPANFERHGDTCLSVAETLRQKHAHCIEGAFVAACALWMRDEPPLVMDMQANGDDDHVIVLFRHGRCWGAISKSNHIWLRWRDPIYRNLRELAMSYFHEYVWDRQKTLRRYSRPIDLRRFDPKLWVTNTEDCWDVAAALDSVRHYPLLSAAQARHLRARDPMEIRAGKMLEYAAPNRKSAFRD
jgi:hypothetical protein